MTARTLIPLIDQNISMEPPGLILATGLQEALDCFCTGLVLTAENAQWLRCTDKEFHPPRPGVKVYDWSAVDRRADPPEKGAIVVIDGVQALAERINWENCVKSLQEYADEYQCIVVAVASDSDGTRLKPEAFLPEEMVAAWRSKASYEISFARKHFTEVQCAITSAPVADSEQQIVSLGSPEALEQMIIKEVSSSQAAASGES